MVPLHTVEVINSHTNPSSYGNEPEKIWSMRRIRVDGGWLYESRTFHVSSADGSRSYLYIYSVVGYAATFVPDATSTLQSLTEFKEL